jgi:hypothetical protein
LRVLRVPISPCRACLRTHDPPPTPCRALGPIAAGSIPCARPYLLNPHSPRCSYNRATMLQSPRRPSNARRPGSCGSPLPRTPRSPRTPKQRASSSASTSGANVGFGTSGGRHSAPRRTHRALRPRSLARPLPPTTSSGSARWPCGCPAVPPRTLSAPKKRGRGGPSRSRPTPPSGPVPTSRPRRGSAISPSRCHGRHTASSTTSSG